MPVGIGGASYSPTASLTLDAQWTAIPTDVYSYAPGGGTGSAPASGLGLDGTTITLVANTFTRAGYGFAGWNDGTTTHAGGASYALASDGGAIVFTAQWTAEVPSALPEAPWTFGLPIIGLISAGTFTWASRRRTVAGS